MTPNTYTLLDQLPLTTNGKIDRNAITATEVHGTPPTGGRPARPPQGALEEKIATTWADVLGIEAVDAETGFVSGGGQSLSAIRLTLRLEREIGHRIPVQLLFQNGTVADLARAVRSPAVLTERS
jgi:acyl carrier protein